LLTGTESGHKRFRPAAGPAYAARLGRGAPPGCAHVAAPDCIPTGSTPFRCRLRLPDPRRGRLRVVATPAIPRTTGWS